jgi:hypothetical protein
MVSRFHRVWFIRLFYKLRVFAWLVLCQGNSSNALLAKSGLLDGLCSVCSRSETAKHIF